MVFLAYLFCWAFFVCYFVVGYSHSPWQCIDVLSSKFMVATILDSMTITSKYNAQRQKIEFNIEENKERINEKDNDQQKAKSIQTFRRLL